MILQMLLYAPSSKNHLQETEYMHSPLGPKY